MSYRGGRSWWPQRWGWELREGRGGSSEGREGEKEAYIAKGKLVKITFSSSDHMGYCGLCMLNPIIQRLKALLVPIFYFYHF